MDKCGKISKLSMVNPFLGAPRNFMFMLNFDYFQPIKHRTDYSVGALYLANLNLPRSVRFNLGEHHCHWHYPWT